MSSNIKPESEKKYNERFVRWQQLSIKQLSTVNNLFLSFTIGTLGFVVFQSGLHFHKDCCLLFLQLIGYLCLITSFLTGTFATINRLKDFRETVALIAKRKERNRESDAEKLESLRFEINASIIETKRLGKLTWCLLKWQIISFFSGTLILLIFLIVEVNK